jgi:hypothetical protein
LHFAGKYRHYAIIQRELDEHPDLKTHADAARHIREAHHAEYIADTPVPPYWPAPTEADGAAASGSLSFEERLRAAASNPLVQRIVRAGRE